jgi:hypothetical protein
VEWVEDSVPADRISRVKRLVLVLATAGLAVAPLPATAASPSPSPSLQEILIGPPAGYAPVTTARLHGRFTTDQYTNQFGEKAVQAEHNLKTAGFVDGYGLTWTQKSTHRTLVELVIAFRGGAGARDWLSYEEAAAKAGPGYKHANAMPGIDPYFGSHSVAGRYYSDSFFFVKGNDMLAVTFLSLKNDVLALATTQARHLYDAAPAATIPTDQWPENAAKAGPVQAPSLPNLFGVLPFLLGGGLVVGAAALAAGLFLRSTRWKGAPRSMATQLSPDGSHWWDGRAWHDSAREVPPFAQRSGDGGFWWDGHTWRPVSPQTAGTQ